MFEETQSVNTLISKVEDLVARYEDLRTQNEELRQELVTVKGQNEAKDAQIAKLEDELQDKELEGLEILEKIESVLGK